jgi:hypothetical protein
MRRRSGELIQSDKFGAAVDTVAGTLVVGAHSLSVLSPGTTLDAGACMPTHIPFEEADYVANDQGNVLVGAPRVLPHTPRTRCSTRALLMANACSPNNRRYRPVRSDVAPTQ